MASAPLIAAVCFNGRCPTNWKAKDGSVFHRETMTSIPAGAPCPGCSCTTIAVPLHPFNEEAV